MNSPDESVLLARSNPAGLGLATDRSFRFPQHLQLINREIVEVIARGKARRRAIEAGEDVDDKPEILLVEAPPRHGKSTLISEYTPPWYLGMFPDDRVILTTYEADFASTWGRKARDTLIEHGPRYFGVTVDEGSIAAKRWDIKGRHGGMQTAGVGGPITGKGANCLPAGTMVKTEIGDISIDTLCRSKHRPRVATYLEDGTTRYRRIEATRTTRSRHLLEVQTAGGHRLGCTPEHRVFVHGRGYIEAKDLRPGDQLVCLKEPVEHALSRLPHDPPQVEVHTVSTVRDRSRGSVPVYDLQVEGENNFFAEGVLVHNCLIVDDPIKNAEEAMSDTIRQKHWDWWLSTARTRLEPGGVAVVLMTRWHEDDLGGRLLKSAAEGGDPVKEIRLPALAGDSDLLGRKQGEPLWPTRYSKSNLENTRNTIGAYWFSAMYQGQPTPDEGGVFNRRYFRYFRLEKGQVILDTLNGRLEYPASSCTKVSYVDLAAGEKQTSDYTVLTEVWVTPGRDLLIRNVTRDRIPGPDQPAFFRDHYVGKLKVEQIGYQTALIRTLLREGLPVEPVYPDKDKVTRASAAGALYRGGKIFHMAGAEYLADFEAELLAFPAGEHDDQVDTVAYAARDLATVPLTGGRTKRVEKQETVTGGLLGADM